MTQFEKTYNLMKKPWAILLYLVLVILAYHFVDRPMASYFHQLDLRANFHILNLLTTLGKVIIYVVLFTLAGLYFRYIATNPVYEARSWYLLACVVIANLVCLILKTSLGRARPDLLFTSNIFGFYWFKTTALYWSLPSGHTTTVISVASGFGVIFPKYFYAFLGLAFLIVLTRVLLYYHYLSDVMTAFYLCILVVGVFTQYIKRNQYLSKAWVK
ncbi:phosphatase PAP2 family protein [Legionella maioricensis]|uniref:Phosphatase PAP2 family protein n=1 Tax=Legionella maioricensis TaxID=2896528 RepID=A0A9X2D3D9_9GAMM|nr:phosphatase PAP2 family protein [Legionella maioricensis]MCL9685619.1 phosphatase PAP2 family protein [Legionella maioricensis]MCL9689028.1 phosphatase PAP2 family protein [Legionella maioricensis]